ncbi:MAG TPA: GH3 auxin-responsive promoter family protein [Blastocatellia bacterium]|nr:GH3 auxin-responsive promoter family protein [Blastocatellia bacterium]
MKSLSIFAANALWYLACLPQSLAFHVSARAVAGAQRRLLARLLRRNANTEYGLKYGFDSIRTVVEYQSRAPLTSYEDYRPLIERAGDGQSSVLTGEPPLLLEPTSGSTSATKLIPYTASLKAEFQRGVAPWIIDLYSHYPSLLAGQAYWSVTPVTQRERRTSGGLTIGFEEESEYLSRWQRALAASVFAAPPLVKLIDEMESFRYVTLLFLLRSRRLALISIWNPTFLTLLIGKLEDWRPKLVSDIASGAISTPTAIEPGLLAQLRKLNPPDPARATEIEAIFRLCTKQNEIYSRLWPGLRLISCWADAHAGGYARELAGLFPQARVQGKGLLATEGFVSLPLHGRDGAALSLRSHFFEFLPVEDSSGSLIVDSARPMLAHELRAGARYSLVITTGGGLYRYQLRDIVEVTGHYAECPLMRFVGKDDQVSDWFGEKLNALHVERILAEELRRAAVTPAFAMLACETACRPAAYTLFIETFEVEDRALLALGGRIEGALRENFHYDYCRELGQLGRLKVFRIEGAGSEAYLAACQSRGQRAGDIKPAALHRLDGWSRVFHGDFIASDYNSS